MVLYNIGCKIIVKKQENILRLLIVEDEKQICDMVAKSLYAAGYEVDTCYDGKEAVSYTHLDVYKRQLPYRAYVLRGRQNRCFP